MLLMDAFRSEVPEGFLEDLMESLSDAYSRAIAAGLDLFRYDEERTNAAPFIRRALVEEALREVAVRHGAKVNCVTDRDDSGFWNHRRLKFGRFVLTQHTLPSEDANLRPSAYKQQLAATNNHLKQKLLFVDSFDVDISDTDNEIHAVLVHARTADGRIRFAQIRFPKPEIKDGYFYEIVDLLQEFPPLDIQSHELCEIEEIGEPDLPSLIELRKVAE